MAGTPSHAQRLAALAALDRAGGELPLGSLRRLGGIRLVGAETGERAYLVRQAGGRVRITDVGLRALLRAEGAEPHPAGRRR